MQGEREKFTLAWEPGVFPDEEREIAKEYFDVVDLDKFKKKDGTQFFLRGSLNAASKLKINLDRFDCRNWVPWLKNYMLSTSFWWNIPSEIHHYGFPLFVRPDSAKKIFAGQVYSLDGWLQELSYLKQRNVEDCLCFCASPEKLKREWRCLFVGMELVGVSAYMEDSEILESAPPEDDCKIEKVKDLAREIRRNRFFFPEDNITIDIAETEPGDFKLVEINFLETSGWYFVDKSQVYTKLLQSTNYD